MSKISAVTNTTTTFKMKAQLRTKPKMTPKKDPVHDRDESQNDVPVDRSVLQGKSKYHTLEASRVNSRTISLKSLLATMSMDPAAMFLHLWMPSYCRQPSARGKQHSCPLRRVRVALNARRCLMNGGWMIRYAACVLIKARGPVANWRTRWHVTQQSGNWYCTGWRV